MGGWKSFPSDSAHFPGTVWFRRRVGARHERERFVTFLVTEGYLDSADRVYKAHKARGAAGDPHNFAALLQSGFGNKPVKDRIEHVLTHASKVHPQMRAEYETAYCTFWEKTPYSMGAFAGGGGGGDRLAVLGKPDGRLFLGCAAVSGNGGWQEGAIAAAWKQVKAVHERAITTTPQTL